ncbi:hypothetical protein C366_06537 [Cryptococcus neoformans Tu401-1]|nr:hypothetical protein C366_06537 [Cryptococcus neoformans var. grubii Tu401-1]
MQQAIQEMDEKRILERTRTFCQWIKKHLPLKQNVLRYTENVAADGDGIDDLEDDDLEYGEFLGTLTHRKELKKPEGTMILASEQGPDSEDE